MRTYAVTSTLSGYLPLRVDVTAYDLPETEWSDQLSSKPLSFGDVDSFLTTDGKLVANTEITDLRLVDYDTRYRLLLNHFSLTNTTCLVQGWREKPTTN